MKSEHLIAKAVREDAYYDQFPVGTQERYLGHFGKLRGELDEIFYAPSSDSILDSFKDHLRRLGHHLGIQPTFKRQPSIDIPDLHEGLRGSYHFEIVREKAPITEKNLFVLKEWGKKNPRETVDFYEGGFLRIYNVKEEIKPLLKQHIEEEASTYGEVTRRRLLKNLRQKLLETIRSEKLIA